VCVCVVADVARSLAIAHRESGDVEAARRVLCAAVSAAPLLWCAWHELALIVDDERDDGLTRTASSSPPALARAQPLALPAHWMRALFAVRAHRQLEHNVACVRLCVALERTFPRSSWLRAEHAIALYNLREIDAAAALFEKQLLEEPSRLDNLVSARWSIARACVRDRDARACQDSYSNILYVNEESGKLSMLAHRATSIDRYRPETCYIVGNYYSMKGEHAKAIVYFKRALRLDPRHLGTWTLVGHEYVELKNTEAAVEAYRKAVDANRRDYRAWYGLGQTYEILKMPLYALHYFRCAAAVRPFDARMWCSLGSCFEQLARIAEAIRCYERAVGNNDREGVAYKVSPSGVACLCVTAARARAESRTSLSAAGDTQRRSRGVLLS
jgi:anaphase-promoting complex subunit 8